MNRSLAFSESVWIQKVVITGKVGKFCLFWKWIFYYSDNCTNNNHLWKHPKQRQSAEKLHFAHWALLSSQWCWLIAFFCVIIFHHAEKCSHCVNSRCSVDQIVNQQCWLEDVRWEPSGNGGSILSRCLLDELSSVNSQRWMKPLQTPAWRFLLPFFFSLIRSSSLLTNSLSYCCWAAIDPQHTESGHWINTRKTQMEFR